MSVVVGWPAVGVMFTILLHGAFSVWWASKITVQISTLNTSIVKLNSELSKRDSQISAAWKRIDSLGNRVTAIETKCNISHKEEA